MSAGRFFVAPSVLADPLRVVLPPEVAGQVRAVLRLTVGDTITLLDGTGVEYRVTLTEVGRERVTGSLSATEQPTTEPRAHLTLCVGLLKAAKFEWVIQKGTELGVRSFVPVLCHRSVAETVSAAKLDRWRTIATEAAEQSERTHVPTISAPSPLVESVAGEGLRMIAALPSPAAEERPANMRAVLGGQRPALVRLFIGPEGGFSPEEMRLAQAAGVRAVTLGPRTLRAETAAIVAATLALDALGELG